MNCVENENENGNENKNDNNNNYTGESNIKIFVGNIPFQCIEDEFKQCFKNIPGFISAEIVTRYNSPFSRGFGFVTLKTLEDAKKLIHRNDIIFKGRILRFTEYNFQDKIKIHKQHEQKNYLFIKNVPKEMTREQLKNIFSIHGTVGACFINTNIRTGESRGNAVVEIKEDDFFEKLINQKNIKTNTDHIFEVSRWRNKIKIKHSFKDPNYKNKINSKEIYRIAFNAGVNVGRLEGLRIANHNSICDDNEDY